MSTLRLHHVGIILKDMKTAKEFLERFGLEKDYCEYVEAYHAHCLFTKYDSNESPIELIIPTEGVLTEYRDGKADCIILLSKWMMWKLQKENMREKDS